MKLSYLVEITDPKTHLVNVKISGQVVGATELKFFIPAWSPGSYLMREYGKNIKTFKAQSSNGEYLNFLQMTKNIWKIDFQNSDLKSPCTSFTVEYQVYCHELTVRTSHIDESHAYLQGPTYLMGIVGLENKIEAQIEFKFPALWSKIHTGLKDISTSSEKFIYSAESYDVLVDCPVEIGCHDSDGFMFEGKEHHVIWYGEQYPHREQLKKDIEIIIKTVAGHFSSIPYEDYTIMIHNKRGLYGGLEHLNSTALQFDGRKFNARVDYINWLALVAHEYFHTWNVKRIRPKELGPFDYINENYTRMHWLTEGLTSFMDEIFVLRSGLCNLREYLAMQTKNLQRYFSIPGKKFHSLEDSSFNTWIKLYRPDENSNNSSISYYLKGGLVFSTLHFDFLTAGKNINDLLTALWERYLANPDEGMETSEVLNMIETIGSKEIKDRFEIRISTTEDIDFEAYYRKLGMEFVWDMPEGAYLGVDLTYQGDRVVIGKVIQDGPAYISGLNAGDEIIAINSLRVLKIDIKDLSNMLLADTRYNFQVSRLGTLLEIDVMPGKAPRVLKEIKVIDEKKALSAFS